MRWRALETLSETVLPLPLKRMISWKAAKDFWSPYAKFKVTYHFSYVTAIYFIDSYRVAGRLPLSEGPVSGLFKGVLKVGDTLKALIGDAKMKLAMDVAQFLVYFTGVCLLFDKYYIVSTKFPRPKYKGWFGFMLHIWIRFHWITFAAGIGLKEIADKKPEWLTKIGIKVAPILILKYATFCILAEAIFGIVVKGYIVFLKKMAEIRRQSRIHSNNAPSIADKQNAQ